MRNDLHSPLSYPHACGKCVFYWILWSVTSASQQPTLPPQAEAGRVEHSRLCASLTVRVSGLSRGERLRKCFYGDWDHPFGRSCGRVTENFCKQHAGTAVCDGDAGDQSLNYFLGNDHVSLSTSIQNWVLVQTLCLNDLFLLLFIILLNQIFTDLNNHLVLFDWQLCEENSATFRHLALKKE